MVPGVRSDARLIHPTLGWARISFVLKSQLPPELSWDLLYFKPQPLWSWAADSSLPGCCQAPHSLQS